MRLNVLPGCQTLAIALAITGSASAQAPRQVRFEYERQDGAAACPDVVAIQAGVAARLGYEPFDERAGELLRATIHQSGHGLEARIEMTDANGGLKAERKLVSHQRDCAELASAVELAVSIAIDPFRMAPSPPGPSAREQAPGSAAAKVASHGAEPTQAQPAARAVRSASEPSPASEPWGPFSGRAEVGVIGSIASEPSSSLGVVVGVGLRGGDLSLGIEGRADLPASAPLRVGEASASLLVASLVPCVHFRKLAACALATAGALRAAGGGGLLAPRQVTVPYVALGARLAVAIPVTTRLSLAVHGDLATPLTKTELDVDGSAVWSTPALAFALGLGVAASFP